MLKKSLKRSILIGKSDIISQALLSNGLFINIDNLAESKKIINSFAPEHLHIAFDHDNFEDEDSLKAGLILKGKDSANSLSITYWVPVIYYLQILLQILVLPFLLKIF